MKDILEWPTLKRAKNIQKFLGFINYYCQFIKDFTIIARLLYDMVKKDQKWKWKERQEEAFKKLNKRFTKEPVLAVPDLDKKMRMEVDTLDYATERVLSIEYKEKIQRLVAYLSKSLNKTERNYKIHSKKMLAVIKGLEA